MTGAAMSSAALENLNAGTLPRRVPKSVRARFGR